MNRIEREELDIIIGNETERIIKGKVEKAILGTLICGMIIALIIFIIFNIQLSNSSGITIFLAVCSSFFIGFLASLLLLNK